MIGINFQLQPGFAGTAVDLSDSTDIYTAQFHRCAGIQH